MDEKQSVIVKFSVLLELKDCVKFNFRHYFYKSISVLYIVLSVLFILLAVHNLQTKPFSLSTTVILFTFPAYSIFYINYV
mgnify:CR=1 FL=1